MVVAFTTDITSWCQFDNLLADCLGVNLKQKVHRAVLSVRARDAAGYPVYPWPLGLRSPPRVCGCLLWWPVGRKLEGIKVGNICRYCSPPALLCPWPHFFLAPVAFISQADPELATQQRPCLGAAPGSWKNWNCLKTAKCQNPSKNGQSPIIATADKKGP